MKLFNFYIENPLRTYWLVKKWFNPLKWKFSVTDYPLRYIDEARILSITTQDVQYKWKYDTPRFEDSPYITICLFNKWYFTWQLTSDDPFYEFNWWEMAIWLIDKDYDLNKARETWPWIHKNISTWNVYKCLKNIY